MFFKNTKTFKSKVCMLYKYIHTSYLYCILENIILVITIKYERIISSF